MASFNPRPFPGQSTGSGFAATKNPFASAGGIPSFGLLPGNVDQNTRHVYDSINEDSFASSIGFDWNQVQPQPLQSVRNDQFRTSLRASRMSQSQYSRTSQGATPRVRTEDSKIMFVARNIAAKLDVASLTEPDELILSTEDSCAKLYPEDPSSQLSTVLAKMPSDLIRSWDASCANLEMDHMIETHADIGPGDDALNLRKAIFTTSLLFTIYHPPLQGQPTDLPFDQPNSLQNQTVQAPQVPQGLPQALMGWLNEHHNPWQPVLQDLMTWQPNPTAHPDFWNIITATLLRGYYEKVVQVLQAADFRHAASALDDGHARAGYRDLELENVKNVIREFVTLLQSNPVLTDDDWNVTGTDWSLFRRRCKSCLQNLNSLAEGQVDTTVGTDGPFRSRFASIAKPAQSPLPATIYQTLKAIYGMLMGNSTEIVAASQDWLESTLALTIFWDGTDSTQVLDHSILASPDAFTSARARERLVDANPEEAYLSKLAQAFAFVTASGEEALQVNSNDQTEVALASICEGNIGAVFGILQAWSLPVAAAAIEIGTFAEWYYPELLPDHIDGLDEEDLLVMSYGRVPSGITKDGILTRYADAIRSRRILKASDGDIKEGWEVSLQLLSRLDNVNMCKKKVIEVILSIELVSDVVTKKAIDLCYAFNLEDEAAKIAEKYADHIADTTQNFGTVISFYSQGKNITKLRKTIDLLFCESLSRSAAYPREKDLDPALKLQLLGPKRYTGENAILEEDEATSLSARLSGYATLRRFYSLRDAEIMNDPKLSQFSQSQRLKRAARAITALIASAADSIKGGLFDDSSDSVVPVQTLVVLFAEALPLLNERDQVFDTPQLLQLLGASEDLEAVDKRIINSCADLLMSTVSVIKSAPAETTRSVSSLSSKSGFSIVSGNFSVQSLDSVESALSKTSSIDSSLLDMSSKAWDWRKMFSQSVSAEQIMFGFRESVARSISKGWVNEVKQAAGQIKLHI